MSTIWFNLSTSIGPPYACLWYRYPIGDRLHRTSLVIPFNAQSFVAGVANFYYNCNRRNPPSAIYAGSRTQSGSLTKD